MQVQRARSFVVRLVSISCLSLGVSDEFPAMGMVQRAWELRGASELPSGLHFVRCANARFSFSGKGLEIGLAQLEARRAVCGIGIDKPLAGDFQLSIDYSLDDVVPSQRGGGSGVKVLVRTTGSSAMSIALGHMIDATGNAFYLVKISPGNQRTLVLRRFPARATARGSLHLTRAGKELTFGVSRRQDAFTEVLHRTIVDPQPVECVRTIHCTSGVSQSRVTISGIRIKADRFNGTYVRPPAKVHRSMLPRIAVISLLGTGPFVWSALFRMQRRYRGAVGGGA